MVINLTTDCLCLDLQTPNNDDVNDDDDDDDGEDISPDGFH